MLHKLLYDATAIKRQIKERQLHTRCGSLVHSGETEI